MPTLTVGHPEGEHWALVAVGVCAVLLVLVASAAPWKGVPQGCPRHGDHQANIRPVPHLLSA
jgi:hypothetical protein